MDRSPLDGDWANAGGKDPSYIHRPASTYGGVEYEKTRKLMAGGTSGSNRRFGTGGEYDFEDYDADNAGIRRRGSGSGGPRARNSRAKKRSRAPFFIFYIMLLMVAMIVCVVIFTIAFKAVTSQTPGLAQAPAASPPSNPADIVISNASRIVGVVKSVDTAGQKLALMQTDNDTNPTYELSVNNGTDMRDAYGKAILFPEFAVGDIVDAAFDPTNNVLSVLDKSGKAWSEKSCTGVVIDTKNDTITRANNTYGYNPKLIVRAGDDDYDITGISPSDTVDLSGYNNTVWYLGLVKGHGTITIISPGGVRDGTVTLDTSDYQSLSGLKPLVAQEGNHRIIVKGSNIEQYQTNVTVSRDQDTPVDLTGKLKFTSVRLTVNANVADYTLTIDGSPAPSAAGIDIDPGPHAISVSKAGYVTFNKTVDLSEDTSLDVTLKQDIKTGSITIMAVPASAAIYIDGADVGPAPVIKNLTYGKHTVVAKYPGYVDYSMPLTVDAPDATYQLLLTPVQ